MPRIKRLYRAKAYYTVVVEGKPPRQYVDTYHFQTKWRRDRWVKMRVSPPPYTHFKKADKVEVSDSEPIIFRDDFEELS